MFSSSLDIEGNQVKAKSFARLLKQVVRHLINYQASGQLGSLIVSIDGIVTCIALKYCQHVNIDGLATSDVIASSIAWPT